MESEFEQVRKALEAFGIEVVKELEDNLQRAGANASGELSRSLTFRIKHLGEAYNFQLLLDDYYTFVDKGRKPGKRPPIQAILKWIGSKQIEVSAQRGYGKNKAAGKVSLASDLRKTRTLAFLIQRKIGLKGTKPTHFFTKTINDERLRLLQQQLSLALQRDVEIEIKTWQ
jgi:hypothetical protein